MVEASRGVLDGFESTPTPKFFGSRIDTATVSEALHVGDGYDRSGRGGGPSCSTSLSFVLRMRHQMMLHQSAQWLVNFL